MEERQLIAGLTQEIEFYAERRELAKQQISHGAEGYTYAAVLNMNSEDDWFTFATSDGTGAGAPGIWIQPVSVLPYIAELAWAIGGPLRYLAVGRYVPFITHELVVTEEAAVDLQTRVKAIYCLVAAIRAKSKSSFLVPVASNFSWSAMSAVTEGSCKIHLIEDYPSAFMLERPSLIKVEDFDWAGQNLLALISLMSNKSLRLALDAHASYLYQSNLRMATAHLWSGIEALFGSSVDTTHKVASRIAVFMEDRGPSRLERYDRIKKLYGFRSKVVHGQRVNDEELEAHVIEAGSLLADILVRLIENAEVPDKRTLDACLFT